MAWWGFVDEVQNVTHAFFLGAHIHEVIGVGLDFERYALYDFEAVGFETHPFYGVV